MAVYKGCPFCERVFDLTDDATRLGCHIRVEHAPPDDSGSNDDRPGDGGRHRENGRPRRTIG